MSFTFDWSAWLDQFDPKPWLTSVYVCIYLHQCDIIIPYGNLFRVCSLNHDVIPPARVFTFSFLLWMTDWSDIIHSAIDHQDIYFTLTLPSRPVWGDPDWSSSRWSTMASYQTHLMIHSEDFGPVCFMLSFVSISQIELGTFLLVPVWCNRSPTVEKSISR